MSIRNGNFFSRKYDIGVPLYEAQYNFTNTSTFLQQRNFNYGASIGYFFAIKKFFAKNYTASSGASVAKNASTRVQISCKS